MHNRLSEETGSFFPFLLPRRLFLFQHPLLVISREKELLTLTLRSFSLRIISLSTSLLPQFRSSTDPKGMQQTRKRIHEGIHHV